MFWSFIFNRFIGSIFLISGTSIGAGMLGLPIRILGIDFYFNLIIFFLLWLVMFISAVAMLEISLWVKGSLNIVSISKYIFGYKFSYILVFFYILFLYSLISAYISGGSTMLIDLFIIKSDLYNYSIILKLIFIFPFCLIIFFGINLVDYINRILFFVLMLSYFILSFYIFDLSCITINNLKFLDNRMILFSLPIMITSFGYSLLIPTLKLYLFNNIKVICIVIFFGSFIPFIIYIVWEYLISTFFLNIGNKLYIQTLFSEGNPTEKLVILMSNNSIFNLYMIFIFSFFSISSSFIGVSLGIYDFFFDLFNLSKNNINHKFLVLVLIFYFPLLFSLIYPYGFILALSYAGIFASILLILFPIYTLWYGRYIKKLKYRYILFNNKFFLFCVFFVGLLVIFVDLIEKCFV